MWSFNQILFLQKCIIQRTYKPYKYYPFGILRRFLSSWDIQQCYGGEIFSTMLFGFYIRIFFRKNTKMCFFQHYKSFYFLWCIVSTYNLPSSLCNTSETGEGFSGPRPVVNRGDAKDLPCTWFRLKRSWEWQGYDRTKNWKRKGFWCSLTLPRGSLVDFGGRPFFVSK